MNKALAKIISLLLALITLFSCISCQREAPEENYDKNRRLEIINEPPVYTEEFIEGAANSFADIAEKLVRLLKNVNVSETQKTSLRNYFKIEIFPIIVMVRIYSDEVDALFSAVLELLSEEQAEMSSFEIFANLYKAAVESLDSTRAGLLAFEFSKTMISEKAEKCRARYEKYGYSWYLDDAIKYETLEKAIRETLGKDKFATAGSVVFFALSSVYGIGMPKNELGLSVSGREALAILEMQADYFIEAGITEGDWKIFFELLSELIPENNASHINAELYALKKNDYFVSASEIMVPLLTLYEATTDKLLSSGEPLYLSDGSVNLKAVIRAATDSEEELSALFDKIEASAKTNSKAESDAVSALKLNEAYESFIAENAVKNREELLDELKELAYSEKDIDREALSALLSGYAVGIAPYIVFAVFNNGD